jgi:hypothetical protein
MTLPKGFDPEEAAKKKAAEEGKIADALTEKEILLKILEKMTSIDKHLDEIHDIQAGENLRKKFDRDTHPGHFAGL